MRPIASLSLDLDNLWSYMKTYGDPAWASFPSYLDIVVPRILHFLAERELTITFFIVGQDAALPKNQEVLQSIAAAGHEIGNHTFHHDPWLHLYSEPQIDAELCRAEESIEFATGRRPCGFRGPGFSMSNATLRVLARRGYLYDATTLPNFLNPLARTYFLMTCKLSAAELKKRKALFGSFRDGLRPLRMYRWQTETGELFEIPVTTMPIFKIPIHVSYILYLSKMSRILAVAYFQFAISLCRLTRSSLSLLLHPLDFLGRDDLEALSFFPGMKLTSNHKLAIVSDILRIMSRHYTVMPLQQYVQEAPQAANCSLLKPNFDFS